MQALSLVRLHLIPLSALLDYSPRLPHDLNLMGRGWCLAVNFLGLQFREQYQDLRLFDLLNHGIGKHRYLTGSASQWVAGDLGWDNCLVLD